MFQLFEVVVDLLYHFDVCLKTPSRPQPMGLQVSTVYGSPAKQHLVITESLAACKPQKPYLLADGYKDVESLWLIADHHKTGSFT